MTSTDLLGLGPPQFPAMTDLLRRIYHPEIELDQDGVVTKKDAFVKYFARILLKDAPNSTGPEPLR